MDLWKIEIEIQELNSEHPITSEWLILSDSSEKAITEVKNRIVKDGFSYPSDSENVKWTPERFSEIRVISVERIKSNVGPVVKVLFSESGIYTVQ